MELYGKYLKPNGIIHLKTDSNFLFQYTVAMANKNNFEIIISTTDLYNSGLTDEIPGIRTFYEEQWLNRGMKIKYLKFIPHGHSLMEPSVEIEPDTYRSFGRSQQSMKQQ